MSHRPGAQIPGAERLVELTNGLLVSHALVAAEEFDLFTVLSASDGATPAEFAAVAGIEERPAVVLLTACAALGLLTRDGSSYRNTELAERYLVRGRPYYFGHYIRMLNKYVYPGWSRVTEAVRTNKPSRKVADGDVSIFEAENRTRLFWDGLYPLSAVTARALAEAVDLGASRRLLDVGGGGAAFAIELCRRFPKLDATVYDLPHVCELTAERLVAEGMADRIGVRPGDFFADADLPGGHDTVLLSMVLHDWDEERDREILAKCFRALPSGGTVVVSELLVDDSGDGPLDAALMSLNMLAGTFGRNYTEGEYRGWLADAGFAGARTVRFRAPAANGVIIARKP
ncbi:acetylserotonin O-methyltransferase [Actinomadura rupiterrae]|uniref:acetylserotonin O-methyltransferase n=1 Tax=Actinomadura rupiterrae TaxID=559627 RepID=UPI0020A26EB2|nr:acetylserotonin O-methyltransferase [Actinomadura rupiterrae]MCP2336084.1 SAM-dependent methyltransferase [Actinomadura rupiterrae]